eukprot:1034533-Prymnesium_polylepis.1
MCSHRFLFLSLAGLELGPDRSGSLAHPHVSRWQLWGRLIGAPHPRFDQGRQAPAHLTQLLAECAQLLVRRHQSTRLTKQPPSTLSQRSQHLEILLIAHWPPRNRRLDVVVEAKFAGVPSERLDCTAPRAIDHAKANPIGQLQQQHLAGSKANWRRKLEHRLGHVW